MEIIIKIDDDLYTRLFDNGKTDTADMLKACTAIRKGDVLPKGHGRLIDSNILKGHIDKLPCLPDGNFAGNHSALKALINMQPTIIEADKEQ